MHATPALTGTAAPRAGGPSILRVVAAALLVAGAYYLGARIGFVLRLPSTTPSILWPPNAILTAVLLLAPPRRWWIYLAAALPAHLLAELGMGWPVPLVLALFVTNCSEALLAAAGVRLLSDSPARFDTLRRVAVFIGSVVVAAFLSSFADAAVVTWQQGEPYWQVLRTRMFSNTLAALTLVPAVVFVVRRGAEWFRYSSPRRRAEVALLVVTLVTVGLVVFAGPPRGPEALPISRHTPLALLLPFLLWAAVRFGTAGASLSLLATAVLAIVGGTEGRGPFSTLPPAEGVLDLQIFLSALGIPLLCLGGATEDRLLAREDLEERLRFEELLSRLSGAFVHLPSDEMGEAFETWLRRLGGFLGLDRLTVGQFSPDQQEVLTTAYWAAPGVEPPPRTFLRRDFPWAVEQILGDRPIVHSHQDEPPNEAARETGWLRRQGIRSYLILPLAAGDRVLGGLAFVSFTADRNWTPDLVQRLRLVAEVFANALARRESDGERKRAELEAQRVRQELAHFTRVSTVGELSTSLAHQLNQPLTGILTNAQAGQRFLDASPPDLAELGAILADVIEDVKRAGEVIHRLRELLRKDPSQLRLLDLNELIREVVHLTSSDAVIRNVSVTVHLAPQQPIVNADRVQLQQVVLNLLVNAMEAAAEAAEGNRTVVVRTEEGDARTVRVSVEDSGPGIREGSQELIFEPFYTTKPDGMGMGLSIARSIVAAHGGAVVATAGRERGAVFHFTLPLAVEGPA